MVRVEPEAEVFGKDEAFAKISMELLKTDKYKKILSDLDVDEVNALTSLLAIGRIIKSDMLEKIVNDFLELRVSKDRLGRKEILSFALASTFEGAGGRAKAGISSLFSGLKA